MADEDNHVSLRVLVDAKGHNAAKALFDKYIRREDGDFSKLPAFLIALDKLVAEFGGRPTEDGKSDRDDGEDYEDDEDLHEEDASEVDNIKRAVNLALARVDLK